MRCFYDADEQIELWGKYLAEELPVIYGEQAAAVVVFVSAEYGARDWTRLERRAALARAVRERQEYVLPARFDDTPLPGLLADNGRGRPAHPDPAAVRPHDRRQAGRPRHRRVGAADRPPGQRPRSAGDTSSTVSHVSAPAPPPRPVPAPVPPAHLARTLTGHAGAVVGLGFSPDGRLLATASDDMTARVWDPATGRQLRTLTGHTGAP
jgi:WD40 repeat protein